MTEEKKELTFEVEKLEILGKHYSNALKEAVEGEDTKVEVVK